MIKTTIVFDYGTEEFAVTIYDQHVDPHAMLVQHRGTITTASKEYDNLSHYRLEVRHEGQPDDVTTPDELDLDDLHDLAEEDDAFETLAQLADRGQLTQAEIDEWVYGVHGGPV